MGNRQTMTRKTSVTFTGWFMPDKKAELSINTYQILGKFMG